jgi:quercetin dioxygenase-like cupin family protein
LSDRDQVALSERPAVNRLQEDVMIDSTSFFALDTGSLPWETRTNPHLPAPIFRKLLHTDQETGMLFQLVRYPCGVVNPTHTHPCAHAMYVLEGTLVTHKGRFGPGSFVWFPEGEVMWHGASADGDVTVLLVSNKSFSIHYPE